MTKMTLTTEEHMQLLQSEFDHVDKKCLKEILEHYDYDYESARKFVDELFPGESTVTEQDEYGGLSDPSIYLQITPEMFDSLYEMFNSLGRNGRRSMRPIREDFGIRDPIYLPIQNDLAYDLYWNLLQYVQNSYVLVSQDAPADDPDKSTLGQQESLTEIMAMEETLRESRKDYLRNLTGIPSHDPALYQEWLVEKKRDFLFKYFPGVDQLKLNELFDLNLWDVSETIKDIEAFYDCKLPLYYHKSLYSDMVKRGPATGSVYSDESDYGSEFDTSEQDERQFRKEIERMITGRTMLYVKLNHLKRKKLRYISDKKYEVVHLYQQEITRCYEDLKTLSDDLIHAHQNHSYPNDQIDFHGLILEEVRIILPWVLQFKHSTMKHNKCTFKIITGIGANGIIRRWVADYILRKQLINRTEGPGAFSVSLYANNSVKF